MKKTRQILAIAGIVLLLSMYVVCLILAITGKHEATTMFKAALGATIAVPLVLYAFLMLLKVFPKDFFVKKQVRCCRKYEHEQTSRVGNFSDSERMVCRSPRVCVGC